MERCAKTCLPAYQGASELPQPSAVSTRILWSVAVLSPPCSTVSLRQPFVLHTDASLPSLLQVPKHVRSLPQPGQRVKENRRQFLPLRLLGRGILASFFENY